MVPTPPRVAIDGSTPWLYLEGAASSCRNSRTARNDSDQLGLDPVVIHVSQPLLESLACCGRPRPRVVIVVQTPPRVTVVVPAPPRVTVVVSIQRIRSLIVQRAMVGAPPRVVIVACSRCSRRGGAILLSTGYGRYRYPHPARCEFAYLPRLHRLHNYTVLSIAQS